MPRSVNSVASRARRKKVLKQAKGYFGRRKNVWTVAKNAVDKAMQYAYRDRKTKNVTLDLYGSPVSTPRAFTRNVVQPIHGKSSRQQYRIEP